MSLPVRLYGDPVLRDQARSVDEIDKQVRVLIKEMYETMRLEEGIGLAAPQVGERLRLLVIDETVMEGEEEPRAYINPVIDAFSQSKSLYEEGCLSIPGIRCDVERPDAIRLTYTDFDGQRLVEEVDGLHARVLQHEIDHLDGVLFIDRISRARRNLLGKKLRKIQRESSLES